MIDKNNNSDNHTRLIPDHEIRGLYDDSTIRVYQAYSDTIADSALAKGTFVSPPFKMERMTWIKPSFLWMMYRAGWGNKDEGQKRILAIDITREGFEWALAHACLSHADESMSESQWQQRKNSSPVRIQWDPERNLQLHAQKHRAIQIGLGKEAVQLYVNEWIRGITDVTPLAKEIQALVEDQHYDRATALLPLELPYVVQTGITIPVPVLPSTKT
ncbi:DUF4291 domain-containing protein [Oxalobacteraceae bacterium]|nr:DUF4291 domain-containing protein [Oxalobacteraceae bacterium]